jgi:hypothetical protein
MMCELVGRERARDLSRLFIVHSDKDKIAARAFKKWLCSNGWQDEEVFLDIDAVRFPPNWTEALHSVAGTCEAVILLVSSDALSSREFLAVVNMAEIMGKVRVFGLLGDIREDDPRLDSFPESEIFDLTSTPQNHLEWVDSRGKRYEVRFNDSALSQVKDFLTKRRITPLTPQSIFVSFSSQDEAQALEIVTRLEEQALKCWISCRDIPKGEDFQDAIPKTPITRERSKRNLRLRAKIVFSSYQFASTTLYPQKDSSTSLRHVNTLICFGTAKKILR